MSTYFLPISGSEEVIVVEVTESKEPSALHSSQTKDDDDVVDENGPKILSKKEIIAKKEVAHTIGERKILQTSLESPFLVGLKFSFQTASELFLVTDFKSGGELFWHLQKESRFSEERARFYIAELVLALEHLHKYDIVYR